MLLFFVVVEVKFSLHVQQEWQQGASPLRDQSMPRGNLEGSGPGGIKVGVGPGRQAGKQSKQKIYIMNVFSYI